MFQYLVRPYDDHNAGFEWHSRDLDTTRLWRLVDRIRGYLSDQRDYRHLVQLPEYLLTDIGLTREDVTAEMRRSPF
jgi:uncharacterized protein YjiS (DUF1127 family)